MDKRMRNFLIDILDTDDGIPEKVYSRYSDIFPEDIRKLVDGADGAVYLKEESAKELRSPSYDVSFTVYGPFDVENGDNVKEIIKDAITGAFTSGAPLGSPLASDISDIDVVEEGVDDLDE